MSDDLRGAMQQALDLLEKLCPNAGFVIVGADDEEGGGSRIATLDNLDPETVRSLFEICLEETDFFETTQSGERHRVH